LLIQGLSLLLFGYKGIKKKQKPHDNSKNLFKLTVASLIPIPPNLYSNAWNTPITDIGMKRRRYRNEV